MVFQIDGRNGISLCEFLLISRYNLVSRLPRDLEVPETVNVASLSTQNKINQALRHLFGPSGKFRSEKQEEGLLATIEGKSPLFIILPTGAGKSLMFEIPALFKGAKSTIVIVPDYYSIPESLRDSEILCVKIWVRFPTKIKMTC